MQILYKVDIIWLIEIIGLILARVFMINQFMLLYHIKFRHRHANFVLYRDIKMVYFFHKKGHYFFIFIIFSNHSWIKNS